MQPSTNRKGRTITPAVEVRVEFDETDELLTQLNNLFATARLFQADGTHMGPVDFSGGIAKPEGFRLAPGKKAHIDFTFSKLQVRVAGTFYFEIMVQVFNNGSSKVVTVNTNTFVTYDS